MYPPIVVKTTKLLNRNLDSSNHFPKSVEGIFRVIERVVTSLDWSSVTGVSDDCGDVEEGGGDEEIGGGTVDGVEELFVDDDEEEGTEEIEDCSGDFEVGFVEDVEEFDSGIDDFEETSVEYAEVDEEVEEGIEEDDEGVEEIEEGIEDDDEDDDMFDSLPFICF
jgi:hypothetical protein